jgi:hypothetical protein
VVLAALIALATVTGGTPQAESRLARHVADRAVRLGALRVSPTTSLRPATTAE